MTFELSGASALSLWRAFERSDGVWLRRRVTLPETPSASQTPEGDIRLPGVPTAWRQAFEGRSAAMAYDEETGRLTYVLPVLGRVEPLGLIEIETKAEIDNERLAGLSGMLRIYRSHLAALDYADNDELTGLANRRTFDDHFRRFAQAEAKRPGVRRASDEQGARAHIGVADIDFFKLINDRFGHPYGDEVLVLFAGLMRRVFRETDKMFRFGGEEFVILMPNCALDDALAAFERFRAAVEAYPFPQVGRVTVSIGVSSLRTYDTGSAAFGRADQALYAAKRGGRNCVRHHETLEAADSPRAAEPESADIELF